MLVKLNSSLLQRAAQRFGISDKLEAIDCLKETENFLVAQWGKGVLEDAQPKHIKNNILIIRVVSSVVSASIENRKEKLLAYIKEKTGKKIKKIKYTP